MRQQRVIRINADEIFLFAAQFRGQFELKQMFAGILNAGKGKLEMIEIAQPCGLELAANQ